MGYAIARAAWRRGAAVTLVTGPTCLDAPWGVETVAVESAEEMREAVLARIGTISTIIMAAAVADYRPALRAAEKIKKTDGPLSLELVKNPDILGDLGNIKGERILVGFAAETGNLLENAAKKLAEKNLDMVVANDVSQAGAGFNVDTNIARLLFRDGRMEELPLMMKGELADVILDRIVKMRQGRRNEARGSRIDERLYLDSRTPVLVPGYSVDSICNNLSGRQMASRSFTLIASNSSWAWSLDSFPLR